MKEILKDTLIYSIARIIPGITGFILLPVYTNYLLPEEYGIVQSMQVLSLFLVIFFSLASEKSIFRLYYDYESEEEKKLFLGNVFIVIIFSILIFTSILFGFRNYTNLIFKSVPFFPYYVITIVYSVFISFSFIPLNLFQVKGLSIKFSIYSIVGFFLTTISILFFVVVRKEGALGILIGQLIASGIMFVCYIYEILRASVLRVNYEILKNIFRFCIPFIPVSLSVWFMNMSSRVFLDMFVVDKDLALFEVGIYSFAFKVASVGALLMGSVFTAYNPIFFREANRNDSTGAKLRLKEIKFFYAAFALLISFAMALFSKDLIKIFFSEKYYSAVFLVPILSFSFFVNQLTGLYNLMIYQEKRTTKMMFNLLTSSIITILLSLVLVSKYSSLGAALASLSGIITNNILQYLTARKAYYIHFEQGKIFLFSIILYLIVLLDLYFLDFYSWLSILLKIILFLFIGLILRKKLVRIKYDLLFKKNSDLNH